MITKEQLEESVQELNIISKENKYKMIYHDRNGEYKQYLDEIPRCMLVDQNNNDPFGNEFASYENMFFMIIGFMCNR